MHYTQDWNGMILHLYRQIDSSMFPANTLRVAQGSQNKTYTAFGNFDRLCFTPVKSFVDYLKRSGSAYQWIGGRKDIMLYPIGDSDNSDRHFIFDTSQNDNLPELRFAGNRKRRFLILSMLYLSDKVKSKVYSYETILKKCKSQVRRIVNKYNELMGNTDESEIFFEMFGTFNSAEIAILWGADQFADVQFLVDQIRFLSLTLEKRAEPIFTTSYSIVSCYDRAAVTNSTSELKGAAYIQLAIGTSRDPAEIPAQTPILQYLNDLQETVKKDLPEAQFVINACAGEYDYIIQTHPPQLGLLSRLPSGEYGALHGKNPNFTRFFANSTTRLAYGIEDIPDAIRDFSWAALLSLNIPNNEIDLSPSSNWDDARRLCSSKESYKSFKDLLHNSSSNVSSLATNVELLYGDFIRAANATPDRQWAYDLEMQINTAFDILSKFRDPNNTSRLCINRDYIEKSEVILQRLRQQIHHVTEAGKLSFDEPSLHIASTVEYDLLFHMYYGAVKDILDCVYDRSSGSTQSAQSLLIPLIQFELTPIVKSTLYHDIPAIQSRIIDISIPYDAWGEPNIYISYLIHEICHYVAPFNRDVRNDLFAKFIITEVVVNAFQHMVEDMLDAYRMNYEKTDHDNTKSKASKSNSNKNDSTKKIDNVLISNAENALISIASELRTQIFSAVQNTKISALFAEDAKRNDENDENYLEKLKQINAGDTNWHTYKEVLLSWCLGENGYDSDQRSTLAGLVADILKKAKKSMGSRYTLLDYSVVQNGFESCTNSLEGCTNFIYSILMYDCAGTSKIAPQLDLYEYVQENTDCWAPYLNDQLRELLPDQAMVELAGLGVSEYLFTFAVAQEKLFNTPAGRRVDSGLPIRIGYIVDQQLKLKNKTYEERVNALHQYRADFVRLYTSYMRLCNWVDTNVDSEDHTVELKANQWFDLFATMLSNYYSQYGCYQESFEYLSKNLYLPLFSSDKKARLRDSTAHFYDALRIGSTKELFKSNLKAIWVFQHQKFLSELSISVKPQLANGSNYFNLGLSPLHVQGILSHYYSVTKPIVHTSDLYGTFESVLRNLSDTHLNVFKTPLQRNGLWYRGSQNSSYGILPSAMVHFLDTSLLKISGSNKGENAHGPLWSYQKDLLEKFKYQADGASEFINSASFTMPDYLALMQHYQQYTCYLDWSEDAFSSLFFALEQYIMDEKVSCPFANASLYVLDPMLYNRARSMIVKEYIKKARRKNKSFLWLKQQNAALLNEKDGYIPNLSTKENLARLPMFTLDLPGNFSYTAYKNKAHHSASKEPKDITLEDVPEEVLNLPIAVHTSRLNPRIRTQSGQFIAYSPFALPAYGPTSGDFDDLLKSQPGIRAHRFTYMSLLKIQDFFLKHFPKEQPFMYELMIHAGAKADIANYLKSTGINRYRIYPELTHLKL